MVISFQKAGGSGLQLQFLPAACLTGALHLSAGSPQLFPVSLRTPPMMSTFGGWGALTAFLVLLCCQGEPGGPDWVCSCQRIGRLFPWCRVEKGVLVPKSLRL